MSTLNKYGRGAYDPATGLYEWYEKPSKVLPTTPGSVIGWTGTLNGVPQYAAAILSTGDETGEPEWWVLGFSDPRSPAKLKAQLERTNQQWELVGRIGRTHS